MSSVYNFIQSIATLETCLLLPRGWLFSHLVPPYHIRYIVNFGADDQDHVPIQFSVNLKLLKYDTCVILKRLQTCSRTNMLILRLKTSQLSASKPKSVIYHI